MTMIVRFTAVASLFFLLSGCGSTLQAPHLMDSSEGLLDLRTWDFARDGSVVPQGWLWDAGVHWSPDQGGRPESLPLAAAAGPPDRGGVFNTSTGAVVEATTHLRLLVPPKVLGLQIGAIPGDFQVWINGVPSWKSRGTGTVLAVQPKDGVVDLVVEISSTDPLIRYTGLNRLWIVGAADSLVSTSHFERLDRFLQSGLLFLGLILLFIWYLRNPEQRILRPLMLVFLLCLASLVVHVEQPEPLLERFVPEISTSLYLILSIGLSLWTFPVLAYFLHNLFPQEVNRRSVFAIAWLTLAVCLWDLFPIVSLLFRWEDGYSLFLKTAWVLVPKVSIVLVTLFLVERCFQAFQNKRPSSAIYFFGGIPSALLVLFPIFISYFLPMKSTYFWGWAMVLFLSVATFELARKQFREFHTKLSDFKKEKERQEVRSRFINGNLASYYGKENLESLELMDHREAEVVLVLLQSSAKPALWLPKIRNIAVTYKALLVEWQDDQLLWVLEGWSETAITFSLEVQRAMASTVGQEGNLVLARARVQFEIHDVGSHYFPLISRIPRKRLDQLLAIAERYGAKLVLDSELQDGVAMGGWYRHRHLTLERTEIELYEAEDKTVANLKDKTLDSFEEALAHAKEGRWEAATQALFLVVQQNPFDLAARTLLMEWSNS